MTGQLERDVRRALETFVAEIASAAERAAIEGIHSAFARASSQGGLSATADHAPASDQRAQRRRAPTLLGRVAVRARVLECIRVNPGWDTTQLGRSLGSFPSKLRRPLRELANEGTIRFEERSIGSGGPRRRVYFVSEPVNETPAHTEPLAVPAEPPAVRAEAMA